MALIAAHPDDEVIGFGGQMASVRRLSLIHLTEGAPSTRTARMHGFATAAEYARARRNELEDAVKLVRTQVDWLRLDLPDQLVSIHMRAASWRLASILRTLAPDLVMTHPYEGGHPDHDSAALITRAALRLSKLGAAHWEMTSYYAGSDGLVTGRFLQPDGAVSVALSPQRRGIKRAMLSCFTSQRATLSPFEVAVEQFRLAPAYDFTRPPHPGRLHYETRRRAMTGAAWRRLAAEATDGALLSPALSLRQGIERAALRLWITR